MVIHKLIIFSFQFTSSYASTKLQHIGQRIISVCLLHRQSRHFAKVIPNSFKRKICLRKMITLHETVSGAASSKFA